MSGKPHSWQAIRDQRRKENFVGRADQLRAFSDNFVGDAPNYMLFAVTGEGGVGKSTLLAQCAAIASSPSINAITIMCDDRHPSPAAVMGHVASELATYNISHKDFDGRYKKYRELRQEIESDPKAPRSAVDLLALGVTDFTIKTLRKAPGVGVLFEHTDEKAVGEALAQLVQYGISRWGNKDEVQLLRDPERALTPLFLDLLAKACDKQRLVLMFDVFERTRDTLSPWLLALFNFEYGDLDTRLVFVLSGRDSLEQHWTELAGVICRVLLEPFTLEETRLYLSNQNITDERLISQIHADTGGLPVLVELLAAAQPQPGMALPDISKDAVARFLQWTPQEERRRVALLAAVPRQFNRDILSAALGSDTAEVFNWLSIQSYIRTNTERGWFYHEKVRELMLRYLRNTTPGDLTATHTRLAEFFATTQEKLNLRNEAAYKSETWRSLELERVYHALSAHPDRNIPAAINAFLHAFRWRWGFSESIARTTQHVSHESSSRASQECADMLLEIFRAYDQNDYAIGIKKLDSLESYSDLTQTALCECHALRGHMYQMIGKYELALVNFDHAVALDEKYAWAIASRGLVYQDMGKYEQALADFDRAITLDEKFAWAIASRGETYRQMGKYEQALADFDRAITLDEKSAWAIASRGETYRQMGKYEQALADFNRAITLDEKSAWTIASRGQTYQDMGKHEQALADFDRAITLDEKSAWALALRGETYRQMAKYEQALADFDRAIALNEKYAWAITKHGETYQDMGKYEQSLADFDRAITLDEKSAWALALRGETYRQMGKYEEALADFNRALSLNQKYVWAIISRGRIYRLMGKYEQALADFDHAINLDQKHAWALERRNEIYLQMGKYEQALADVNRAIELNPESDWRHYRRWLVYRVRNDTDKAHEDLVIAVEYSRRKYLQDPNNWRNSFNLALYHLAAGEFEIGKQLYHEVLGREAPIGLIREAIDDLDSFLTIFTDHPQGQAVRTLLKAHLDDRSRPTLRLES